MAVIDTKLHPSATAFLYCLAELVVTTSLVTFGRDLSAGVLASRASDWCTGSGAMASRVVGSCPARSIAQPARVIAYRAATSAHRKNRDAFQVPGIGREPLSTCNKYGDLQALWMPLAEMHLQSTSCLGFTSDMTVLRSPAGERRPPARYVALPKLYAINNNRSQLQPVRNTSLIKASYRKGKYLRSVLITTFSESSPYE